MPGTRALDDIELIIEDTGSGGGGGKPPRDGGDGRGGNGGGDGGNHGDDERGERRQPQQPAPAVYTTAVAIAAVSILMLFMAMAAAFLVLRATSNQWVKFHLPSVIWVNTAVLLASSLTIEIAQRRLAAGHVGKFQQMWLLSTGLGLLFLVGQLIAWWQLMLQRIFVASNQASSFFYVFTAAHGLHLLGGVAALFYVAYRDFGKGRVSRAIAAEVTSYYWHFMDGLWLFLLALLYLGR